MVNVYILIPHQKLPCSFLTYLLPTRMRPHTPLVFRFLATSICSFIFSIGLIISRFQWVTLRRECHTIYILISVELIFLLLNWLDQWFNQQIKNTNNTIYHRHYIHHYHVYFYLLVLTKKMFNVYIWNTLPIQQDTKKFVRPSRLLCYINSMMILYCIYKW